MQRFLSFFGTRLNARSRYLLPSFFNSSYLRIALIHQKSLVINGQNAFVNVDLSTWCNKSVINWWEIRNFNRMIFNPLSPENWSPDKSPRNLKQHDSSVKKNNDTVELRKLNLYIYNSEVFISKINFIYYTFALLRKFL